MLKIVFCFNSGEHRQADSTDLQSDGPYRPQALVSSDNSDNTSDEDAGYCKFVPPTAVDTTPPSALPPPQMARLAAAVMTRRMMILCTTIPATGLCQKCW